MIDYSILAVCLICVSTLAALWTLLLYKPAEDGMPPFPLRRQRLVVEFSDGHATTLPSRCEH